MTKAQIYLDNNATTRVAPECIPVMMQALEGDYGNPSSKHAAGEAARMLTINARSELAALLGATPPELVFTSGGTESIHYAIHAALAMAPEKRRIVTTQVEHSATLLPLKALKARGYEIIALPVDHDGKLDLKEFDIFLTQDTALVSVMWANNETGVLFPIPEMAAMAVARGVLIHCDAVQAVGKLPINLKEVPLDFLSLSGHKFHAPKGTGALFVRKGHKFPPLLSGHQERARRGGTENVPAIAALGVAATLAAEKLAEHSARLTVLRDSLEQQLLDSIPGATVTGAGSTRIPGTTSLNLGGRVEAEFVLDRLDKAGICASAGSACSAGGTEPSHVMLAMGLTPEEALSTIRISLSRYTSQMEVDQVVKALPAIVEKVMSEAA